MQIRALTWNLFHGRDFPPDPALFTWRSRLLRITERNDTHVQVNRDLLGEFAGCIAGAEWDVALLQECPPRWAEPLAARLRGRGAPRAHLPQLRWAASARARPAQPRPDRLQRGRLQPDPGPPRPPRSAASPSGASCVSGRGAPERRAMAFTRTAAGLCVANLHATNDRPQLAAEERDRGGRHRRRLGR